MREEGTVATQARCAAQAASRLFLLEGLEHSSTWPRMLRGLLGAVAIGLLLWCWFAPSVRDAQGHWTGQVCLPLALGLAAILVALTFTHALRKAALWLALALVGQAAALQLIDAGPTLRYQHYRPFQHPPTGMHLVVWIILAAQLAFVAWGLWTVRGCLWTSLRQRFRAWQLCLVALTFVLTSATLSEDIGFYLVEVAFATGLQALNLATVVLMMASAPQSAWERLGEWSDKLLTTLGRGARRQPGSLDGFTLAAALWVTCAASVLNLVSYQRHPHVPDEVVYLYHARYLAEGHLTMPLPAVPEAFDIDLMEYEDSYWFCPVPPGWPAVLAVGVWLGAPWLVNPVLAGLNVLLLALVLRRFCDVRSVRLGVLLLCLSPWYLFLAMSFMTHMLTLTGALCAIVGLLWARETGRARWAWLAGMAVGMVSLIRPLDAVTVAAPLGLWTLGLGGRRQKASAIAAFVLGALALGTVQLAYNQVLTGKPTKFPIMAYTDKHYGPGSNDFGFGPNRGLGWGIDPHPGHNALDALINANLNATGLNSELFGWSIGSLLLASIGLFGLARLARGELDVLMLGLILSVFGWYFCYYFSGGPDFGARYWFLMLPPFVVLTLRGVEILEDHLRDPNGVPGTRDPRVVIAVLSLCALSLVNWIPWRALDKYYTFRGMRSDVRTLAQEFGFDDELVLVQGKRYPDYASAAIYNPIDLQARVPVYAWDRSDEIRKTLVQAFPDRKVWIVRGPSLTGAGFEVVRGPLRGTELLGEPDSSLPNTSTPDGAR